MLLSHEKFITEALGCSKDERKLVKGKGKLGPQAEKGWVEKWRQDLKIAAVRLPLSYNLILMIIYYTPRPSLSANSIAL